MTQITPKYIPKSQNIKTPAKPVSKTREAARCPRAIKHDRTILNFQKSQSRSGARCPRARQHDQRYSTMPPCQGARPCDLQNLHFTSRSKARPPRASLHDRATLDFQHFQSRIQARFPSAPLHDRALPPLTPKQPFSSLNT